MVALHRQRLGEVSATGRSCASTSQRREPGQRYCAMNALFRDLQQPEYLHVLLNPLPVYGLAIALIGLLLSLILRSRRSHVVCLGLVLFTSAMAWPVFELGQ